MNRDVDRICNMLRQFVRGDDRSLAFASALEVALDKAFPDDDECQDMVLALASYRPGGGEYLYDEEDISKRCRRILARLCPAS